MQLPNRRGGVAYSSFEPFSHIILEKLSSMRDQKHKLGLFNEIMNDEAFKTLHVAGNGAKTVCHPLNRGKKAGSWQQTKEMAFALNEKGRSVAFLPEYASETSADALTIMGKMPRVVDFKYSSSTKVGTLVKDLSKGFKQSSTIVLKLENMGLGEFRDVIESMKRNEVSVGNIILINNQNKVVDLSYKEFAQHKYMKKLRGFL